MNAWNKVVRAALPALAMVWIVACGANPTEPTPMVTPVSVRIQSSGSWLPGPIPAGTVLLLVGVVNKPTPNMSYTPVWEIKNSAGVVTWTRTSVGTVNEHETVVSETGGNAVIEIITTAPAPPGTYTVILRLKQTAGNPEKSAPLETN